ncbi:MAG: UDP-N-acetylmuramoyl-L-alanyl-D-glutamate--2,6-diaminopimelate ligase [Prevotella sp.]|nr:UDP-N-acetylmuramoyl-L-alanyl-D-glutamate--2,6-diaminopimelate ligase [Prevotella sp.]
MKLSDLIKDIPVVRITGNSDVEITGVNIDSRRIGKGHLFVAVKGTQTDGHRFISAAIEKGAVAVLCEQLPEDMRDDITYIETSSTEAATGFVATAFYGYPSQKLRLVGVTGTNGKTTIATLLYQMFRKMGHKCGLLSTVCNYIDGEALPADHTTPDPIELNKLLHDMVAVECEYAFMECSSHAIDQQRIGGLTFEGGIFTNLTRDHIDYHKTFENYRDAKKKFFDALSRKAFAITNADDRNGAVMVQNCKARIRTYGIRSMADFKARILECHFEGMYLEIDGREVGVQFIGKYNVSNLLAVYGAAVMLGKPADDILLVLSTLKSVSGRMEYIRSADGKTAVVDYAHTPDAIVNVIQALREVMNGKGELITVCGCGGNRDKGKRPIMAREAVKASDKVILTSDNPRLEDPDAILDDMEAGLSNEQKKAVFRITDRRQAIRTATALARPGDVILVAGKGHEDYQILGTEKHHFDDREEVRAAFGQ